ncbi:hypothetical protein CsSME_00042155 [Camellia sinensis var. sinensis]
MDGFAMTEKRRGGCVVDMEESVKGKEDVVFEDIGEVKGSWWSMVFMIGVHVALWSRDQGVVEMMSRWMYLGGGF